jgi:hypothetical protein
MIVWLVDSENKQERKWNSGFCWEIAYLDIHKTLTRGKVTGRAKRETTSISVILVKRQSPVRGLEPPSASPPFSFIHSSLDEHMGSARTMDYQPTKPGQTGFETETRYPRNVLAGPPQSGRGYGQGQPPQMAYVTQHPAAPSQRPAQAHNPVMTPPQPGPGYQHPEMQAAGQPGVLNGRVDTPGMVGAAHGQPGVRAAAVGGQSGVVNGYIGGLAGNQSHLVNVPMDVANMSIPLVTPA